ncbi:Predicted transcriptional regulator containing CBS domains [Halobacillus karajensis]|uniref:Cobalt-dependent inorganic pyrophosphatase n=1 Tax=Halobacillus karajensis TaxID=195088 RepID=A0A024P7N5_9BACI|nr:DRTGG domain-containing protein [Halobacillus karajensis]CDQ18293.1 Cobalt-dependent inorganic pyrophosphatase [Halobacillus karajensis]CDQ24646.1 Cobalt-dependent inorganic pyrophosphatase [Halobacillus karajensis]CDQ29107.1 Cobalt-dependent inorganic pyrophosphatase [Halobacillus karajensis]SEI06192.1 Predicted transcriptional regulator containing CBS domains [Halobacillus karajensis]
MATKHEQILEHIESLSVGSKISVRGIAKALNVSEGTAYRAIKEAENQDLVSTMERVGTIRIEKKKKENIERLTFAEIVNIVDGQVLGGREGLYKTLSKFVIGAMKLEAMMRYTEAGSLLIVGNRTNAHELAVKEGAAVLITGGFDTSETVKKLADEKKLPVISTSYDTFTVATMINRAIYDQLIKKEIVLVDDIYTSYSHSKFLRSADLVSRWHDFNTETGHSRYPVVDQQNRVVGIVTSRDVIGKDKNMRIDKVMTRNPMTVHAKTSLANAAHVMVWEGIELMPVVDPSHKLQGIISRQDVLKALQHIQRQPQVGETIDDLATNRMEILEENDTSPVWKTMVTPQMTNPLGTMSYGVFISLITEASSRLLRKYKKGDLVVENISVFFIKPVQIESEIEVRPEILEVGRKFAKVDIEVHHNKSVVGKALLMAQLIDR